jgi:hypothetical protein
MLQLKLGNIMQQNFCYVAIMFFFAVQPMNAACVQVTDADVGVKSWFALHFIISFSFFFLKSAIRAKCLMIQCMYFMIMHCGFPLSSNILWQGILSALWAPFLATQLVNSLLWAVTNKFPVHIVLDSGKRFTDHLLAWLTETFIVLDYHFNIIPLHPLVDILPEASGHHDKFPFNVQ